MLPVRYPNGEHLPTRLVPCPHRVWNRPTISASPVRGRLFPPLDQQLALRADHCRGGAARAATRMGLQARSFDLAAAGLSDAVGRGISGDSVARLIEDWGRRMAEGCLQREGAATSVLVQANRRVAL